MDVLLDGEIVRASLAGGLRFKSLNKTDLPTVGDMVTVEHTKGEHRTVVVELHPRSSVLVRKNAGEKEEGQLIAANVDKVFVVMSCDNNFNERRLERLLVMVRESDAVPVVLLSKSDLVEEDFLRFLVERVSSIAKGILCIPYSIKNGDGIDEVNSLCQAGQLYCLIGSSGAGKSSLLNQLAGQELSSTGETRVKDDRGRHTTRRRELYIMENTAMIIDTPGIREVGLWLAEDGVAELFSDIIKLAEQCRFSDCSHSSEPGCVVQLAVQTGNIEFARYESYLKLTEELKIREKKLEEKNRRLRR